MLKVKNDGTKSRIKYKGDVNSLCFEVATLVCSLCAAMNEDSNGEGDRLFQKLKWHFCQEEELP